jgi:hypothetical protein
MGQAKKRGSYEERRTEAIDRNTARMEQYRDYLKELDPHVRMAINPTPSDHLKLIASIGPLHTVN